MLAADLALLALAYLAARLSVAALGALALDAAGRKKKAPDPAR